MKQVLEAVKYMHEMKIYHRDLKPQNILINEKNEIKVADFGLGREISPFQETMSKEIETLWYRAPELLLGNVKYNHGVDIWSIGCIMFEVAEGRVLFQTESEVGQIMEIMRQQGTPKLAEWKEIIELKDFKVS